MQALQSSLFRALLSLIFLIRCQLAWLQPGYAEFLNEKDIVRKSSMGLELWNEYLRNDLDSLKIMSVDMLLASSETGNAFAKAVGEHALGSYLIRVGETEKGIEHLNEARRYFTKKEDYDELSIIYNELGNGRFLQGKYHEAIKMYLSSLRYGALAPDPTSAFNAKIGLGKSYCAIGDTVVGIKTVLEYKNQAVNFRKFEAAADAYGYLAEVEYERNIDLAKEYYTKSTLFAAKSNSKAHLSHAWNNMAILYFDLGMQDSSLMYFKKSLELRQSINHQKGIVESYNNLGYFYMALEDFPAAIGYYDQCVALARESGFPGDEHDALSDLLGILKKTGSDRVKAVEARIAEIEKTLENKRSSDKEIIAYAEQISKNAKIEEDGVVESGSSKGLIWWLAGGLAVLGLLVLRVRKR